MKLRVAGEKGRLWVQTPARSFFIEPHFLHRAALAAEISATSTAALVERLGVGAAAVAGYDPGVA